VTILRPLSDEVGQKHKFGLAAQRLSRAEIDSRVRWASKLLRLEGLLGRKPAELSVGNASVAIGRALVKQVGLFLFDEPLSNLDAQLRTEMRLRSSASTLISTPSST
jgi:multiple sugar transport system ATP-binding protein